MPTGKQIRAARTLADWLAEDLAEKIGMSRETVQGIERGDTDPRPSTMDKIVRVFKEAGIEFIGDRGVAQVHENYRILEGADCYLRLLSEIHLSMRGKPNAEALFICVDDAVSNPEVTAANNQIRDAGIKCRYLASENGVRFDFDLNDYRVIPERFYTNSVMVVYGDKIATLRGANDSVLIISDAEQAHMMRGLFEMIWLQSPMPKTNNVSDSQSKRKS